MDGVDMHNRRANLMIILLAVFNVILLMSVSILEIVVRSHQQYHDHGFLGGRLYTRGRNLSCSEVENRENEKDVHSKIRFMRYLDENGNLRCIIKTDQDANVALRMLLRWKLYLEERKERLHATRYRYVYGNGENDSQRMRIAPGKPAAHLIRWVKRRREDQPTHGTLSGYLPDWTDEFGTAFRRNGIQHRNGQLSVPFDGVYYVYSQVSFRLPGGDAQNRSSECNATDNPVRHMMFRRAMSGDQQMLMQSFAVCCHQRQATYPQQKTSYLGAVVPLKTDDDIFVKVSDPHEVSADPKSTYFGVYMI